MRFLAVDDEHFFREELKEALEQVRPGAEVWGFTKPGEALNAMKSRRADVAFLDIEMGSMTGLELAEQMKRLQPDLHIVFVTGHQQYAVQAFQLHATGYLLKPINTAALERELTFLYGERSPGRVRVQTFSGFEVFVDGVPVKFGRAKAKELLAYLVDRKGASATTAEARAALLEGPDTVSSRGYFRNIVKNLRESLRAAGVEDILLREHNRLAILPEKLDCDYYRVLRGEAIAVNSYRGDYLPQYSWAEFRNGELDK